LWQAVKAYYPTVSAGRISNGLRQFIECIEELITQLDQHDLGQLIQVVLTRSGFLQYVKTRPGERTQAQVENLHELVQAAKQFHQSFEENKSQTQSQALQSLPDFLSEVALDAGDREVDQEATIKLMTLHSAKGLEFPLVFLAGLEEGLFPHHRSLQERSLLEEERRLCYVGLTRAMRKLYITYAQKRAFAGLSGMNRPSRFIEEIPSGLIETANINTKVEAIGSASISKLSSKDFPFALGQRVRHKRFGEGVIVSGDGQGETARVQVNFVHEGKKWLVLTYAKLEAVDD
jgi:DNA helicase-2/ATP-dependent DNA helicase PcrA